MFTNFLFLITHWYSGT